MMMIQKNKQVNKMNNNNYNIVVCAPKSELDSGHDHHVFYQNNSTQMEFSMMCLR